MIFKTAKCVICGERAVHWDGALRVYTRNCLGGMIPRDVDIGFCDEHYKAEPYYFIDGFKPEYGICGEDSYGHKIYPPMIQLWLDRNTQVIAQVYKDEAD